ncbi:MAG TPA: DSD1 family PLP-dependent enzyme [Bryobacteraceae bacterium]|nr:DSD1 family PLP-dependent enzyme [Bryobacteraceae bacterium]
MLHKSDVPTPALLLDLDSFEKNLGRMAARARECGKNLRPHAKAHKCAEISRRQIDAGACGICVATIAEAEVMANAGITDMLLTSPLGEPLKAIRAAQTGAMVVVDHPCQVAWYALSKRPINVLVDLDVGDHRTRARSVEQALEIAREIDRAPSLRLRGIQAYSVSGSHAGPQERRKNSEAAFALVAEAVDAFKRNGFSTEILSGGSTGTWEVDLTLAELTEFQAGSYALMDLAYRRLGIDFANALTVLATVISANHRGFATVDAGYKAFSTDRPFPPEPVNLPGAKYRFAGDEFGIVEHDGLKVGDRIEFIPPHIDPTVNLYDRIYVRRGEAIQETWPIMDRARC